MSAPSADIRVIRRDDHKLVPWRNGGGVTREIALAPDERGALGYAWRLSQATVSEPGAFSEFPHSDRTLLVLSGEGLELTVAGVPTVLALHEALAFPGDVPTQGRPMAGPVEDLNIICDRRLTRHEMRLLRAGDAAPAADATYLAVALVDGTVVAASGRAYDLAMLDTVQSAGAALSVTAGIVALIEIIREELV
ncbi:HutD family protein [Lacibacterium aquatile]|uniref:HutD family protein n=1 Tax=Lacibacterium aquatile TaxID=1168082 RepID=A0ABW5DRV1_9PROT